MTPVSSGKGTDSIALSVIIGTFNGARTLGAALDALESQITDYTYEVIVVNDASTDATATIATRPNIQLINLDANHGHGHTLNAGLAVARGEYAAMMDDDCVPPPEWIQKLGQAWGTVSSDVTMIGGIVEPLDTDTFNRRYVEFRRPLKHQDARIDDEANIWTRFRYQLLPPPMASQPRSVYYAVGANMSVRTKAAREAGGFTEHRGAGEEESLARPLRKRFGPDTVMFFPNIVMYHNFDASLRDTFRRSRSYGVAHGKEWVRTRGIPTLSPLPLLALITAFVAGVAAPLLAISILAVSPYVLYRRWLGWRRSGGSRDSIVYPYVQAAEDLANNVGFLQGVWQEFRTARLSGQVSPPYNRRF